MGLVAQSVERAEHAPVDSTFCTIEQPSGGSVLDDFLSQAKAHEGIGAVILPSLYAYSVGADIATLLLVMYGYTLSPDAVTSSLSFLGFSDTVSDIVTLLHIMAAPLGGLAASGLVLKCWARGRRTGEIVHLLCLGDISVAVLAAAPFVFLAAWIALYIVALVVLSAILCVLIFIATSPSSEQ